MMQRKRQQCHITILRCPEFKRIYTLIRICHIFIFFPALQKKKINWSKRKLLFHQELNPCIAVPLLFTPFVPVQHVRFGKSQIEVWLSRRGVRQWRAEGLIVSCPTAPVFMSFLCLICRPYSAFFFIFIPLQRNRGFSKCLWKRPVLFNATSSSGSLLSSAAPFYLHTLLSRRKYCSYSEKWAPGLPL